MMMMKIFQKFDHCQNIHVIILIIINNKKIHCLYHHHQRKKQFQKHMINGLHSMVIKPYIHHGHGNRIQNYPTTINNNNNNGHNMIRQKKDIYNLVSINFFSTHFYHRLNYRIIFHGPLDYNQSENEIISRIFFF